MNSPEWLLIIVIVGVLLLSFFVLRPWRVKRAVIKVIQIFIDHNATSKKNAITIDVLGIKSPSLFEQGFKFKDFKKEALDFLLRVEIIQVTDDYKFYIEEARLLSSKLYKSRPYVR